MPFILILAVNHKISLQYDLYCEPFFAFRNLFMMLVHMEEHLTLFLLGSGLTLIAGAGLLWPWIDSTHSEAVRRCPKVQNSLSSHFFDLQLFKDTKNTIL